MCILCELKVKLTHFKMIWDSIEFILCRFHIILFILCIKVLASPLCQFLFNISQPAKATDTSSCKYLSNKLKDSPTKFNVIVINAYCTMKMVNDHCLKFKINKT